MYSHWRSKATKQRFTDKNDVVETFVCESCPILAFIHFATAREL